MMSINNRLLNLAIVVSIINTFSISYAYSMQQPEQIQDLQKQVEGLESRINKVCTNSDFAFKQINRTNSVAVVAAEQAGKALQKSKQTLDEARNASRIATTASESIEQIQKLHDKVAQNAQVAQQAAQNAALNIENTYNRLQEDFEDLANKQCEQDLAAKIQIIKAKINEKKKLGIFDKIAELEAQAKVDIEAIRWEKIKTIIPSFVLAITAITLITYIAKHGVPLLMNHLTQPRVVIETSKTGWFGWGKNQPALSLTDLIFAPPVQKQLFDLAIRIKSAKKYNENLPNILFYGLPGTGKTAFAKILAHYSGLNYALTSGSEFAKITDLSVASNELRKLLNWAKNDKKGLIVFIDEAESLFANRKLPTTSKAAQDFINTFLSLIPDKSHKKLMFIFATNHPFKLDDAIIDRIGPKIEFILPEAPEREMILTMYLQKFANESKETKVDIHSEVKEKLSTYAEALAGLSPRAIKFVAEEMIINARRQKSKLLTNNIAQAVLNEAKHNLQQETQWENDRDKWVVALR